MDTGLASFVLDLVRDNLMGAALGLVGILVTILLFLRGKAVRRIGVQYAGVSLLARSDGQFPGTVTVFYENLPVPQVTLTRLVIWNDGNQTLRRSDIASLDPLRIEIPESGQILDIRVLHVSRTVTGFQITDDPANPEVRHLSFEFLDPHDGARIEVLHTLSRRRLEVKGTILGSGSSIKDYGVLSDLLNPIQPDPRTLKLSDRLWDKFLSATMFAFASSSFGIFLIIRALFFPTQVEDALKAARNSDLRNVALGILFIGLAALIVWVDKRYFPRGLLIGQTPPPDR